MISSSQNTAAAPRVTPEGVRKRFREGGVPLVCLTAYDFHTAAIADDYVDILLVGDSLGTALYGYETTLPVTLDMMIPHAEAVARAAKRALVAVDLPFGSYQEGAAQAFASAARILKETAATAVKLEGGAEMADTIRFLTERGVPVIGHIGMQPQRVRAYGGFKTQGRTDAQADKIMTDLQAVTEAGAFAAVLEASAKDAADKAVARAEIPLIGIGASVACHGQILVTGDLLGLIEHFRPRFARRYMDGAALMRDAFSRYAEDVRERRFPAAEEMFGVTDKSDKGGV